MKCITLFFLGVAVGIVGEFLISPSLVEAEGATFTQTILPLTCVATTISTGSTSEYSIAPSDCREIIHPLPSDSASHNNKSHVSSSTPKNSPIPGSRPTSLSLNTHVMTPELPLLTLTKGPSSLTHTKVLLTVAIALVILILLILFIGLL